MFTQRDKNDEDWGQWVVVQKNEGLPHPSGILSKSEDEARDLTDNGPSVLEREDEETIKSRVWYAVSGAQNVRRLAEWIQYQTDLALFKKATAASNITGDSSTPGVEATIPSDSPKKYRPVSEKTSTDTPSRQLMVEVRMPQRSSKKADPADLVTKEATEIFFAQLQKIAGFMELNEQPQKLF